MIFYKKICYLGISVFLRCKKTKDSRFNAMEWFSAILERGRSILLISVRNFLNSKNFYTKIYILYFMIDHLKNLYTYHFLAKHGGKLQQNVNQRRYIHVDIYLYIQNGSFRDKNIQCEHIMDIDLKTRPTSEKKVEYGQQQLQLQQQQHHYEYPRLN